MSAADTNLWPLAAVLPRVTAADEDMREAEALALGERWQEELDTAVKDWPGVASNEQFAAALDQIEAAVAAGDIEALATLTVPVLGDDLLLKHMTTMYDEGAAFVVQEAADAGVKIKPATPAAVLHPWLLVRAATADDVPEPTLSAWALAIAARIAARVAAGLAAEATRWFRPKVKVAEVTDAVQSYWDGLTDSVQREAIGSGLSRAVNLGKLDTYAQAQTKQKGSAWRLELRADERLDKNTCEPCRKIDGEVLPNADAAALAYGGAGYLYCKGRERCRGTVMGIWTNKAPKNDLGPATLRTMLGAMREI